MSGLEGPIPAYLYPGQRSGNDYGGGDAPSTRMPPPMNRNFEAQGQVVEQRETGGHSGVGNHQLDNELGHRPVLQDRPVQNSGSFDASRAIEWPFANRNGAEDSLQVVENDGIEYEDDGDDETDGHHSETDNYHRRDRRLLHKPPEQLPSHEPEIARFVRSQGLRRSSGGRAFFSPSALRNGERARTRNGTIAYPLLPISNGHPTSSLSDAALTFATIGSGEFHLCVGFLREHRSLLREDYHLYLQEAWKALWDREKTYAYQCLSRWFLLDECRRIQPRDIGKHINQRTFSGSKFLDEVDDMYNTLKTLRKDILHDNANAQAADRAAGNVSNTTSTWSLRRVQDFMRNVGNAYRLVAEVTREFQGDRQDLEMSAMR